VVCNHNQQLVTLISCKWYIPYQRDWFYFASKLYFF